jgi:hypothetical protein
MSSLAVFLILGGATAFAAKKIGANELKANSVKTGKIVKEAVTAGKLKKNAVTNSKIAAGAVTTDKLANDAVTGDKANESTFGTVPSANNANTVGGNTVKAVNFAVEPVVGPTQILNLNGFTLTASCPTSTGLSVVANGPNGSRVQSSSDNGSEIKNAVVNEALKPTSNTQLLPQDNDLVRGHTEFYLGDGGKTVSVVWAATSFPVTGPDCTFTGSAIG